MGMDNKSILGLIALVLAAVLVGGAVFSGNIPVIGQLSAGDQQPTGEIDENGDALVDDWELSSQVRFPQAPSSAEVCLFEEQPEDYGNHVDFTMSDAKQGKSAGLDYHCSSSLTSKSADLGYIPSGDYHMVVDDGNYHTMFKEVTVPDTKPLPFAEQDKAITLAEPKEFDLTVSYDSDNTVTYDEHDAAGSVMATSADLDGANRENGTVDASVVRTITVDTGVAYLGEHNVSSFNDADGIDVVSATVLVDGTQEYSIDLKDGSKGELSDSTSFGEDLHENVETDPVKARDEIQVVYDITYDNLNIADTTADDGQLGVGESAIDGGLRDIYDAAAGNQGSISVSN